MAQLLEFKDARVEASYRRHFSAAQIPLDMIFNGVLSAVTLSSTIKFWAHCTPLEKVLMPGMVAVSLAVPLAIWLRRDAFLARREPLLAAKHLAEAVIIAHVMPRKIWLSPRDYLTFLVQWFLFAPQVVWPILGIGFRFLLPGFLPLQAIYLALIVACNGHLYETLQRSYPGYMRHFLGWPGAKAALGMGFLSDRTATLEVWTILQVELAFALPLYAMYNWELRDRQHFGKLRAARLPAGQTEIDFQLAPLATHLRRLLLGGVLAAPAAIAAIAYWHEAEWP